MQRKTYARGTSVTREWVRRIIDPRRVREPLTLAAFLAGDARRVRRGRPPVEVRR